MTPEVKYLIYDLHPCKSLYELSSTFKFDPVKFSDVCAYSIMSNHYHLVLKINSTEKWSEKQVLSYWSQLCNLKPLCQRLLENDTMTYGELELAHRQSLMNGHY